MTVWRNADTGEVQVVYDGGPVGDGDWQVLDVPLPEDWRRRPYIWTGEAWQPVAPRRIPRLQFLLLLTPDEVVAAQISTDPQVIYARTILLAAEIVDLDSGEVVTGVLALVEAGILTQARAGRVLDGLPPV